MDTDNVLIRVNRLTLTHEGVDIHSGKEFTFLAGRSYLVTGPFDAVNIQLLKIIGGVQPPPGKGRVLFRGHDLYESRGEVIKGIKKKMAYISSEGILISNLTVAENLFLPVRYHDPGFDPEAVTASIRQGFDFFGIPDILDKRPAEISFYLKKKLAFVRASLLEPEVVLVDKPLFNLDKLDQDKVALWLEEQKKKGVTLIIASHWASALASLIDEFIELGNNNSKE